MWLYYYQSNRLCCTLAHSQEELWEMRSKEIVNPSCLFLYVVISTVTTKINIVGIVAGLIVCGLVREIDYDHEVKDRAPFGITLYLNPPCLI